jgi:DNA/RNA-binding domain of Phe-tRNA-synthetase-like protein
VPGLSPPPFPVTLELPGWELLWARLELIPDSTGREVASCFPREGGAGSRVEGGDEINREVASGSSDLAAALRASVAARARRAFDAESLAADSTVAALRRLFRAAGCDPTRYRPSSEALLRRLLKGEELPAIHPLVDLNNCLSVALAVPCCAMPEGSFQPPVILRAGRDGEAYESLRGPFSLAGKPLLADAEGPFGTPITDSRRVKVQEDTAAAWLVAYLPAGEVEAALALDTLEELLRQAPLARRTEAGLSA